MKNDISKHIKYVDGVKYTSFSSISNKEVGKFYSSREWKEKRNAILNSIQNKCCNCGNTDKLVVDHINPLKFYWEDRLDDNNLQILCNKCNFALKGSSIDDRWSIEGGKKYKSKKENDNKIKYLITEVWKYDVWNYLRYIKSTDKNICDLYKIFFQHDIQLTDDDKFKRNAEFIFHHSYTAFLYYKIRFCLKEKIFHKNDEIYEVVNRNYFDQISIDITNLINDCGEIKKSLDIWRHPDILFPYELIGD